MIQHTTIVVLEPTGVRIEGQAAQAPRLDTLKGKRVGALWNTRPDGDDALQLLLDLLVERYGVKDARLFKKPHYASPARGELLDEVAGQVDAVVTGIGD